MPSSVAPFRILTPPKYAAALADRKAQVDLEDRAGTLPTVAQVERRRAALLSCVR